MSVSQVHASIRTKAACSCTQQRVARLTSVISAKDLTSTRVAHPWSWTQEEETMTLVVIYLTSTLFLPLSLSQTVSTSSRETI